MNACASQSPVGHGYAIWLMPDAGLRTCCLQLMEAAGAHCDGPHFAPHLTVLSGFQTPDEALRVALTMSEGFTGPLPVRLTGLACSEHYFQAVTLRTGPCATLRDLRARAERLAHRPPGAYSPHLSLAYGRATSALESQLGEIRSRLPLDGTLDRLETWQLVGHAHQWARIDAR